ncbi:metal-dependent hydrolase [Halosolutus amylolyticus]|uniref:Metal-dependent hydrolase n=1 Tax=Halosolutus amylolyticus TaxID=2932267 RepID=A0ABD5PVT5_9EURY|nr:metal-dependent hydrolase [Halosolutus amylolyticus]
MEIGRALFLAGAFATHAFVGYALVRAFTRADPRIGVVLGLLPDVDFLFPAGMGWPFVHRGITHTLVFALAVAAGLYVLRRDRSIALAAGLAIGSHLAIDSLSPKGVVLCYPIEATWSPGLAVHGPTATALLWTAMIGLLVWRTEGRSPVR